jgi:hypothetical protein
MQHTHTLMHARTNGRADIMEAEVWNEPSVELCPSYPEVGGGVDANACKIRPAQFPGTFQTLQPLQ